MTRKDVRQMLTRVLDEDANRKFLTFKERLRLCDALDLIEEKEKANEVQATTTD